MRKTLTDKGVAGLKPRASRYAYPDPELAGHYVRVTPYGAKSFATITRSPDGKQVWTTLGSTDRMTVATAREIARAAITRVRAGLPPFEAKGETFGDVVAGWRKRHVERNGLRSRNEIVRLLERHILPTWHNREFISIRRSDIAALMDRMEDENGARQADYALNIVRSVMNWYAVRTDSYNPPIVRGIKCKVNSHRARKRFLRQWGHPWPPYRARYERGPEAPIPRALKREPTLTDLACSSRSCRQTAAQLQRKHRRLDHNRKSGAAVMTKLMRGVCLHLSFERGARAG